jgi:hypothetical protein
LGYWINWLPEEVVEAQFCIVPPIMRDAERIESKVRQIVAMEHSITAGILDVEAERQSVGNVEHALDHYFPQNEHNCVYPSRCPMWDLCYTNNTADDPAGSGLYQPRQDHHAAVEVSD